MLQVVPITLRPPDLGFLRTSLSMTRTRLTAPMRTLDSRLHSRAGHQLLQELREASQRQPQADLHCRTKAGLPPSAVAHPQQAADLAPIM